MGEARLGALVFPPTPTSLSECQAGFFRLPWFLADGRKESLDYDDDPPPQGSGVAGEKMIEDGEFEYSCPVSPAGCGAKETHRAAARRRSPRREPRSRLVKVDPKPVTNGVWRVSNDYDYPPSPRWLRRTGMGRRVIRELSVGLVALAGAGCGAGDPLSARRRDVGPSVTVDSYGTTAEDILRAIPFHAAPAAGGTGDIALIVEWVERKIGDVNWTSMHLRFRTVGYEETYIPEEAKLALFETWDRAWAGLDRRVLAMESQEYVYGLSAYEYL